MYMNLSSSQFAAAAAATTTLCLPASTRVPGMIVGSLPSDKLIKAEGEFHTLLL